MQKNAWDLCTLIRDLLNGQKTDTSKMDLREIYRIAHRQMLPAIVYMALENSGAVGSMEPQLAVQWAQERDRAIRNQLMYTGARAEILEELEKAGIWYVPLKGSALAELYPKIGMRQMLDNDILFDGRYRKDVKSIMQRLGYTVEAYGHYNHDVYIKKPIFSFEMHAELVSIYDGQQALDYYQNIAQRLVSDGGMRRRFTPEDAYLYFLVHGYKHYSGGGNGLRLLLDCHIIHGHYQLNWEYMTAELGKLGLLDFEARICSAAQKLFGSGQRLTAADQEVFAYCVVSGAMGIMDNRVEHLLRELQPEGELGYTTRLKYLWRRFWPNKQWFVMYYPFFAKWWIFKPFYAVWRLLRGIFTRGSSILYEIKLALKKQ